MNAKVSVKSLVVAGLMAVAGAAAAQGNTGSPIGDPVTCSADGTKTSNGLIPSQISFSAGLVEDCTGFYEGNVAGGGSDKKWVPTAQAALKELGFNWDGATYASPVLSGTFSKESTVSVDFKTLLSGVTYLGFHWGKGQDGYSDLSAFYRIDFGPSAVDVFDISWDGFGKLGGLSNAVVYATAPIPEPETYALMLAGLGAVAFVARRRRPGQA